MRLRKPLQVALSADQREIFISAPYSDRFRTALKPLWPRYDAGLGWTVLADVLDLLLPVLSDLFGHNGLKVQRTGAVQAIATAAGSNSEPRLYGGWLTLAEARGSGGGNVMLAPPARLISG